MNTFRSELEALINKHSMENGSNTPDFILCDYLCSCLRSFDVAVEARGAWFSGSVDGRATSDKITQSTKD